MSFILSPANNALSAARCSGPEILQNSPCVGQSSSREFASPPKPFLQRQTFGLKVPLRVIILPSVVFVKCQGKNQTADTRLYSTIGSFRSAANPESVHTGTMSTVRSRRKFQLLERIARLETPKISLCCSNIFSPPLVKQRTIGSSLEL
jgi:hypothetical protein